MALRAAAQRMDIAADIVLDTVRTHLSALQFDRAVAGRAHTAAGGAVRTSVDRVVADMVQWATAARETGDALRAGADCYADAELRSVAALR